MTLKRPQNPIPGFVAAALQNQGLEEAYASRPPFQRNDYLGWIARAKRPETREKRLNQMIDELNAGNTYMGMGWNKR